MSALREESVSGLGEEREWMKKRGRWTVRGRGIEQRREKRGEESQKERKGACIFGEEWECRWNE